MSKKMNRDDLDRFYDYGIDVNNRILYMGSENYTYDDGETGVDHLMVEKFLKGLSILDMQAIDGNSPINVIMNNPGGYVYHGMAIFDAIKSCRNQVNILAYGHAMSMGSIILQAADKRILAPNCTVMIHSGEVGYNGHTDNFIKWADETKRLNRAMEDIYLQKIKEKHPDYTRKQLKKLLDFDTFLTAQEAVDLGLADEVLKVKK